ncbi:CopD family protein [Sandaracinobacteroides sp. A072]|uniref:CopD family protein n=1 Tax=Sandaracinobacteroides sp. A072 TaxID=3461146 RepID=UPI0040421EC6
MENLIGWLGAWYMPVKAAHVVITFFWIAGLFILPRYLVHQAGEAPGSAEDGKWNERITRLRRIILTPSIILAWVLGLAIATSYGFRAAGWIHAKLTLAVLLSAYHGWMVATARRMARGERPIAERKLRLWNEVPAIFTILMVTLAVLKPF